nr:hypothetical protein CFP56_11735 [Quercus suber]
MHTSGSSPINTAPRGYLHNVEISDGARHAFDYFYHHSRRQYAERGYPTMWASHALAMCGHEPALFFALAALGSVESSTYDIFHTSLARPAQPSQTKLTLRLYLAAVRQMTQAIEKAVVQHVSLEPVIVGCAVFVVLEIMRGNSVAAMLHARLGNRILNESLGHAKPTLATPDSRESVRTFDNQMTRAPLTELRSSSTFSTLDEARQQLEMLANATQELHTELLQMAESAVDRYLQSTILQRPARRFCLINSFSKSIPPSPSCFLGTRLNNIEKGYSHWGRAFTQLLKVAGNPLRNILRLQVRFFCAKLTMLGCRSTHELWTDSCYDDFSDTLMAVERLLQLQYFDAPVAESLVERLDLSKDHNRTSHHYFDERILQQPQPEPSHVETSGQAQAAGLFGQGILSALFTIACKCRVSRLRHRAAELLSLSNRVEGPYSSRNLGKFAKTIIALEERQYCSPHARAYPSLQEGLLIVPESARLSDVVVQSADYGRTVYLSCTQFHTENESPVTLQDYKCTSVNMENGEPIFENIYTWQGSVTDSQSP